MCVIAIGVAEFGNILPSGGVALKIALVVDGCLDNDTDLICSHMDTLTDCQNELGIVLRLVNLQLGFLCCVI